MIFQGTIACGLSARVVWHCRYEALCGGFQHNGEELAETGFGGLRLFPNLDSRLRGLRRRFAPILYAGDGRFCPACSKSFRKFRKAGRQTARRDDAICPGCGSRERDRLAFLFLERFRAKLHRPGLALVHIAPENALSPLLRTMATGAYISGDLVRQDVDLHFDILNCPFASETIDAVYCSHVLQDVVDDRQAVREIFRILKPNGWAVLNVPVTQEHTLDHPNEPGKRRWGLDSRVPEHLRSYGLDFVERLRAQGFECKPVIAGDFLTDHDLSWMGVSTAAAGSVFLALKPE